jgi:hypothetical protein
MSRTLLLPITLTMVLFTAWMLHRGWFPGGAWAATTSTHQVQTASHDPFLSQAACQYRHGQPRHWRALMLQQR